MNKDNCRTILIFSKNYFRAIVVSMIFIFMLFYFAEQAVLAEGFANIGPALIFWLLAILNVIIALVCVSSILFRNKAIQYSWVLFYFTVLFLYMFRSGPATIVMKHFNPDVRARFADSLGSKEYAPLLLKMLNDEDKGVRYNAAVSLGRMGVKQGANVLINIIEKDGDVLFRGNAAEDLGWLNDPKGNDFLFNLFKSENQESREIAFRGIRRLDNSSGDKYAEFIISDLNDENENIRESAVDHFSSYYRIDGKLDQQLVEVLVPLLKDKSAAMRRNVVHALIGNSEQKIVEYLLPLLKDPSPEVRLQTVQALVVSGNPLVIEPLISAAQDEDDREVSANMIRCIVPEGTRRVPEWTKDRRVIEFLLKAYQEHRYYTGIQMYILKSLGKAFGEEHKYGEYERNPELWWEKYNEMFLQGQANKEKE